MSKYIITVNKSLSHAGIKGMKWGRRRFQNPDGSLTEAGKKRYGGDRDSKESSSLSDKMSEIAKRNREQRLNSEARRAAVRDSDHEAIEEIRKNTKKIDEAMGIDTTPGAAKAYKESLKKTQESDNIEKGIVPYGEKGIVPKKGAETDNSDKTESFKPGDDGYEIHKAPKTDNDASSDSKSKPKDIYDVDFEDKTSSKKSGKSKTEAEAEEAHKRGEERKKEAEKNRKEEEAEKKENAKEREKNKKEREKEEEEAHKRAEEREKEAKKNEEDDSLAKVALEGREATIERRINQLHDAGEITKDARKITSEIAGISERQRVNVPRLNLSDMSNKQMQDAIQRELIEKQYDSLFNTTRIQAEERQARTTDFIKNVGAAITIAGGAIAIAERVMKWKKG